VSAMREELEARTEDHEALRRWLESWGHHDYVSWPLRAHDRERGINVSLLARRYLELVEYVLREEAQRWQWKQGAQR